MHSLGAYHIFFARVARKFLESSLKIGLIAGGVGGARQGRQAWYVSAAHPHASNAHPIYRQYGPQVTEKQRHDVIHMIGLHKGQELGLKFFQIGRYTVSHMGDALY